MQSFKNSFGRMSLFIVSAAIIALLLVFVGVQGEAAATIFSRLQDTMASSTGWLLIFIMNAVLLFALYLLFTPLANIRLGGQDARPEFSRLDWFGMLFAAGMGIGLLFYSVSEPLQHYAGIAELTDLEAGLGLNLIVIGVVCSLALISVLSGLGNGVRLLSKLNLLIA